MQACSLEPGVVGLEHSFRISLRDGRRVGVHRVQEKLHSGCAAPAQIPSVIIWNNHPGCNCTATEGIAQLVHGSVVANQPEALAFAQCGDQLPALRRSAVVNRSQLEIGYGGAQSESQQQQLESRGNNQRHGETTVAADLREFLPDQGADAMIEEEPNATRCFHPPGRLPVSCFSFPSSPENANTHFRFSSRSCSGTPYTPA